MAFAADEDTVSSTRESSARSIGLIVRGPGRRRSLGGDTSGRTGDG